MRRMTDLHKADFVCVGAAGVLVVLGAGVPSPGADFTIVRHTVSGEFMANVFDGAPPVTASGDFDDPLSNYSAGAYDWIRSGSMGAGASAFGQSRIFKAEYEDRPATVIVVESRATYDPSGFAGGDRPGGMSEARLSSIIEFVMPADRLDWIYWLGIDQTAGYSGSASVVFENVTQARTILTLTEDILPVETVLEGHTGDVIRITTEIQGAGSAPAGLASPRQYGAELESIFLIPEPSTLALLAIGAASILRRRRRIVA